MRVASGARLAPRADARARRGARPTNAPNHHPRRGDRERAWRRSVVERGATTRGARVPLPAVQPWSSPPRRVRAAARRAEADTTPNRVSARDAPLAASFDAADGDFFSIDRRTDDVSNARRRNKDVFETSSRSVRSDTTPSKDPLANETRCLEASDEGTVLGAVALITGSTVGAGALALPATVSPAGIGPSSAVLIGCWGLLVCEALLLAEVNVALMRERDGYRLEHGRGHSPVAVSLSEMAGRTLGAEGAAVVGAAYLFLSATLLTAYVSKSGAIVAGVLAGTHWVGVDVDPRAASLCFAAAAGAALASGGVALADKMNQALTATLLCLFGVLIAGGAASADWSNADFAGDWSNAPACVPVVFLALVYHDLVPVICAYLAGDASKIRRAVIAGSAAPLAMFLAWDAVALGVGAASGAGAGADPLAALMAGGDGTVALVVGGFSFCAIATSFIGTAVGVNAFAQPRLERWAEERAPVGRRGRSAASSESRRAEKLGMRALTYALMLSGPTAIAVTNPDVFLPATNFAGAYGMTAMFGILPPVMAFKMRARLAESAREARDGVSDSNERVERATAGSRSRWTLLGFLATETTETTETTSDRNVGGGTPALAALSLAACAITLGQAREDAARGASLVPPPAAIARLSAERVNVVSAGRAEGTRDAFASLAAPDEVVSGTAALADETRDWLGGAARPRRR
jgi:tyrosine-specific transport protein